MCGTRSFSYTFVFFLSFFLSPHTHQKRTLWVKARTATVEAVTALMTEAMTFVATRSRATLCR
jgi:hypothetical protein